MEVSCQLHALGREPPVTPAEEGDWTPELVWTRYCVFVLTQF